MQRRRFLQSCGITAASVAVMPSPCLHGSENGEDAVQPWLLKTLKIGMVRVPGSLEDKFAAAKAAGFVGIELNAPGFDVAEAKAAAESTGLIIDGTVCSNHWQVRHSDPDAEVRRRALKTLREGIAATASVGAHTILLVPGHGKDGSADEVYERSLENVSKALPDAEKHGVQILIENVWNHFLYDHDGNSNQSADALAEYVDAFDSPWVGVQFDIGNHWKYGDPAEWIRTLGPRIKKLDIKGFSRAESRFTKITEGDIDWTSVKAALRHFGYTGWLAAEVSGGDTDRLREVAAHMEEALDCGASI